MFEKYKADVSGRWGVAFDEGKEPDAVNLWIGTSKSTTTLHKGNVSRLVSFNLPFFGQRRVVADETGRVRPLDPYDNLYQVLSGSKTFTLLSPIEGFLLDREHSRSYRG